MPLMLSLCNILLDSMIRPPQSTPKRKIKCHDKAKKKFKPSEPSSSDAAAHHTDVGMNDDGESVYQCGSCKCGFTNQTNLKHHHCSWAVWKDSIQVDGKADFELAIPELELHVRKPTAEPTEDDPDFLVEEENNSESDGMSRRNYLPRSVKRDPVLQPATDCVEATDEVPESAPTSPESFQQSEDDSDPEEANMTVAQYLQKSDPESQGERDGGGTRTPGTICGDEALD